MAGFSLNGIVEYANMDIKYVLKQKSKYKKSGGNDTLICMFLFAYNMSTLTIR